MNKNSMNKNWSKGFTLIELLVVIAIIGVLSSVVLANLNSARNKGNDAAIRQTMSSLRSQAELYYGSVLGGGRYNAVGGTGVCAVSSAGVVTAGTPLTGTIWADPEILKLLNSIEKVNSSVSSVVCNSNEQSYAVSSALPSAGGFWCVDSTGNANSIDINLNGTTVTCPAS